MPKVIRTSSSARQKVKLISIDDKTEQVFGSKSSAARFLESAPGNLTKAIKQHGTIKGYKVELLIEE